MQFAIELGSFLCHSAGIGLATVDRLAAEGATVAIFDINREAGEKAVADFKSRNLSASYYMVDVAEKEQCVEGVKAFTEANGGALHFLVNCAVYFGSLGLTASKKDWDKTLSVNVVGYSNMVQACHPYMQATRGDKSILNMASLSGHIGQPNRWTYSASKGAILTMTKCMALDFAKDTIRVNSISPAWTWTPEVDKIAFGGRDKWEPVWGAFHMLGRMCQASEVASAVCFLLSEDASFMTGCDMKVDGGYGSLGPEGMGEKSVFAGSEYKIE